MEMNQNLVEWNNLRRYLYYSQVRNYVALQYCPTIVATCPARDLLSRELVPAQSWSDPKQKKTPGG